MVPTLFCRRDFLIECLQSIRASGNCHILVIGPDANVKGQEFRGMYDQLEDEIPGQSLSEIINLGIRNLPKDIELATWIGDDDLLTQGSISYLAGKFDDEPKTVLVYGQCDYINSQGKVIGQNRSGAWAVKLAAIGPFLAPQPGSLFRRSAFESIGGLNDELKLAFDLDLFLGMREVGRVGYVPKKLASFRWHPDSLSVRTRKKSVFEAAQVRLKRASRPLRFFVAALNPLVIFATLLAGKALTALIFVRRKLR